MAMDPSSEEIVIGWLNEKCPRMVCQACGEKQWTVQGLSVAASVVGHKPMDPIHLSFSMPMVASVNVECRQCGCVVSFDAQRVGLVSPNET